MIIEHEANPSWASAPSMPQPKPMGRVDEIEALLRRYPLISEAERARCIDFLAAAPIAERGSLSSRPGMASKMDQLRRDHPKPFKPSILSYAVFGVLIVAIILSAFMVAG